MFSRPFSSAASRASLSLPFVHTSARLAGPCLLWMALLALLAACGGTSLSSSSPQATPTVALDAYGTPITFPAVAPQRIVSLSPSMSEILGGLKLDKQVAAVDYYTTYPADFTTKTRISTANGTYNVEQIVALKPDLVLSDGALTKPYDARLAALGLHVVDLPGTTLAQVVQKILLVGRLTFTGSTAQALVTQMQQQIAAVKAAVAGQPSPRVLLELDDSVPGKPYVFGGGSFGDELLQDADGSNIFHNDTANGSYPQVTDEAIITADPQFVVLTEDPAYGGNPTQVSTRAGWSGISAIKSHQVYALNVNITQHPSQRLVDGLRCLAQIIHPTRFSGALPSYCTGTV